MQEAVNAMLDAIHRRDEIEEVDIVAVCFAV